MPCVESGPPGLRAALGFARLSSRVLEGLSTRSLFTARDRPSPPRTPGKAHGRSSLLGPSWAAEGGEGADLLIERYGNGVINTL